MQLPRPHRASPRGLHLVTIPQGSPGLGCAMVTTRSAASLMSPARAIAAPQIVASRRKRGRVPAETPSRRVSRRGAVAVEKRRSTPACANGRRSLVFSPPDSPAHKNPELEAVGLQLAMIDGRTSLTKGMRQLEEELASSGAAHVVGVDEAGRGPLVSAHAAFVC